MDKPDELMLDIANLSGLKRFSSEYSNLGSEYLFMHITSATSLAAYLNDAIRINGLVCILCRGGLIDFEVNISRFTFGENTLVVIPPDSLFHIRNVDWSGIDAYILIVSAEFLRNINFDINVLNRVELHTNDGPSIELSPTEMTMLCRYVDAIHANTTENEFDVYVRAISRSLIAALFYQVMVIVKRRRDDSQPANPLSRRSGYVRDFFRLLHDHHRSRRSVAFYASKLFITPKYLSIVVKDSTGHSAVDWINQYVILEAKNQLRFSGKSIQQIAYELNFSSQSSFGKYFKNLTGVSPSEFQRS